MVSPKHQGKGVGNLLCAHSLQFAKEKRRNIPVLYGGSVNPENAPELIQMSEVDGLFIGRSSLAGR